MSKNVFFLSSIEGTGNAEAPWRAELLRCGDWDYPREDGTTLNLAVTPDLLSELKANFESGAKGFELPIDGPSRGGGAHSDSDLHDCGWIKRVELGTSAFNGKPALFAHFCVTNPEVEKMCDEGSLKFTSAELDLGWDDPEAKDTKRVLEGMALTNRPFVKGLEPISRAINLSEFPHSGQEPQTTQEATMSAENKDDAATKVSLSETQAELAETKKREEALKDQLAEVQRGKDGQTAVALAETRARLAALQSKVELDDIKRELMKLARKIPLPVYNRVVALAEVLQAGNGGSTTVRLSEKVKLGLLDPAEVVGVDDPLAQQPTDKVDVINQVLQMLQQLPDAVAGDDPNALPIDPNKIEMDEQPDPTCATNGSDKDKDAKAAMAEAAKTGVSLADPTHKTGYKAALLLAEKRKRQGGGR